MSTKGCDHLEGAHMQFHVQHNDFSKHLWRMLHGGIDIGLDILLPDLLGNPCLSIRVKLILVQSVELCLALSFHHPVAILCYQSLWNTLHSVLHAATSWRPVLLVLGSLIEES